MCSAPRLQGNELSGSYEKYEKRKAEIRHRNRRHRSNKAQHSLPTNPEHEDEDKKDDEKEKSRHKNPNADGGTETSRYATKIPKRDVYWH